MSKFRETYPRKSESAHAVWHYHRTNENVEYETSYDGSSCRVIWLSFRNAGSLVRITQNLIHPTGQIFNINGIDIDASGSIRRRISTDDGVLNSFMQYAVKLRNRSFDPKLDEYIKQMRDIIHEK